MSTAANLRLEHFGDVAKITIDDPGTLNSLSPEMIQVFPGVLAQAVDRGARALIITGAGRAFSSGANLGGKAARTADASEMFEPYRVLACALSDLPIPLLTAINGVAAGGGASIALAGDIVLAARSSYLMLAFSRIALTPDLGATWLVARAAGRLKALEMALLAEKIPAEEAYRCGLVTQVVEDAELMAAAEATAARLAAMPTKTLGLIRRQVRAALESTFEASLDIECDNARLCLDTEDFREGTAAFREKRAPTFIGR
jgi:2-(1,2-epoxy-1,2-dihydrophenyl)acetyl-CoA isomerase